jgi:predicted negative regulator of RcsB-dependent stress response
MPNGWWILPSAICGLVIWIVLGWAVYEAVQSPATDQSLHFASAPEAVSQKTRPSAIGITSRSLGPPPGPSQG